MNYNQAMAAARTGQLITINGHTLALLEGAVLTHGNIEEPLILRTMLYAITDKRAIPYTPSALDKESQLWDIADTLGVDADTAWEGRAILEVTDAPQYIEMAAHQLRTSKVVKVEGTRKTDRGIEFFLIGKDLPKPTAGKPTEQVTMVVEQDGEAQVVMAYLSGRSGRYVL